MTSFLTTGQISTKLHMIVPWEFFYQNCSYFPLRHKKCPPELPIEKKSDIFSVTDWLISTEIHNNIPCVFHLRNCSNHFGSKNMVARAKIRI